MITFLKKRYKLILIIALLVFGGFLCYRNFFAAKNGKKVDSVKVKRGTLEEILTISGQVEADEKVTLRFQTSGRLAWVGVKEGDYVKKYQSIASLDQREMKMNLDKYLNTYMSERWDFEQTRDDYKDTFITDKIKRIKEQTQFDLNNTVTDVEIKNLAIELANMFTPIEGIVTRVASPYAGVNVTATQAEFDIVNPKTVYFSALADQTEVTELFDGKPGELTLDAYPESTFSGTIKNISFNPKSGETGTVYAVKFLFDGDNTGYKYRLGMAGDLSFVTKRKEDALYLPTKFVKDDKSKKYVQIKKNGQTEKVYVETGMETDSSIEITKGVTEGTIVFD